MKAWRKCSKCGEPCGTIETVESEEYEVWGASITHTDFCSVSDCCRAPYTIDPPPVPKCTHCKADLIFDFGYPASQYEPGEPASTYCGECGEDENLDERSDVSDYWDYLARP